MGHCGEPNFFGKTMDLKLGWWRPSLLLLYMYTFWHHCPFKGYDELLKTVV
jgi:hypothetical protein